MDYYILTDPHHPTAPITTTTNVPNIAVRVFGSSVSTYSGGSWSFDWSSVKNILNSYLPTAGKWELSITGGVWAPTNLLTMGDTVYSWTDPNLGAVSMCVPWGTDYMAWWKAMMSDAATNLHAFKNGPTRVTFGLQSVTQEMMLPSGMSSVSGYSNSQIESTYGTMISYMSNHWPSSVQVCSDFVPGNMPLYPPDEEVTLIADLVDDLPARSCVQNNGLGMTGSPPSPWVWSEVTGSGAGTIGFQCVGPLYSNFTTCATAVQNAGAAYLEIYSPDLF